MNSKNLDINDIDEVLKCFFDSYKEPFNCEATFQFNLAMFIKENCKNIKKIVFEENIYNNPKSRCDLVIYLDNCNRILIELKYIVVWSKIKNGKIEKIETSSGGARGSFVSDCIRLKKELICKNSNDKKYCILVSNKSAIVKTGKASEYLCQNFFNENFKFDITKNKVKNIEHWKFETPNKNEEIVKYLIVEIKTGDNIINLCPICKKQKKCKHYVPALN